MRFAASSSPTTRNKPRRLSPSKSFHKPMPTLTQRGYLVLADISGFTAFMAGTELEHSHDIPASCWS